jgi:hypothetical protein
VTDIPPGEGPPPYPTAPPPSPYPQGAYPPGAYPPYGAAPYNPYAMAAPPPRNGMGTAGMVLGIISVVLFITSWVAVILGVLAIVFSSIGRGRVKQGLATNRGQAKAGLICGIIGAILGVASLVFFVWFMGKAQTCIDKYPAKSPAYNQCIRDTITGNN